MPTINLQPNAGHRFDVGGTGKYLLIRFADENVTLSSDAFREAGIQTGDTIDVADFNAMQFNNRSSAPVKIDYQISDLKVATNATQRITVQRIIEPIQFNASVKVKDGLKVETIAPAALISQRDKVIPAFGKLKLTSNRHKRKQITVQVISDELTALRIGGENVAADCGALVLGSKHAPSALSVDTSAAVFAFNNSSTEARVSVSEITQGD